MVEAGDEDVLAVVAHRRDRGAGERAVARVDGDGGVEVRVVRNLAARAQPGEALAALLAVEGQAHLEGVGVVGAEGRQLPALAYLLPQRQLLGRRHVRHGLLVRAPCLGAGEARGEVEDRLAVLVRDHAAGRVGATVADAVHDEADGRVVGAAAQEVGVDRVQGTLVDRALRGHRRLRGDHAAEQPARALAGVAQEQIAVELLELEAADHSRYAIDVTHAPFSSEIDRVGRL